MNIIVEPQAKNFDYVRYVMGEIDSDGQPRPTPPIKLGKGSVENFEAGMEACAHKNKLFACTYSWKKPIKDLELANEVCNAFGTLLRGGLPAEDFLELRFAHPLRNSGGGDIHNLNCVTHMPTGIDFPFFSNVTPDWDMQRIFLIVTNYTHGWEERSDSCSRKLRNRPPKEYSKAERVVFNTFDARYESWIKSGKLENRSQGVSWLRSELEVNDDDDDSITIYHEKKAYLFSGGKYHRSFDYRRFSVDRATEYAERPAKLPGLISQLAALKNERDARIKKRIGERFFDLTAARRFGGHDFPAVAAQFGRAIVRGKSSNGLLESALVAKATDIPVAGLDLADNTIGGTGILALHAPSGELPLDGSGMAEGDGPTAQGKKHPPHGAGGKPGTGAHFSEPPLGDSEPNQPPKNSGRENIRRNPGEPESAGGMAQSSVGPQTQPLATIENSTLIKTHVHYTENYSFLPDAIRLTLEWFGAALRELKILAATMLDAANREQDAIERFSRRDARGENFYQSLSLHPADGSAGRKSCELGKSYDLGKHLFCQSVGRLGAAAEALEDAVSVVAPKPRNAIAFRSLAQPVIETKSDAGFEL